MCFALQTSKSSVFIEISRWPSGFIYSSNPYEKLGTREREVRLNALEDV